MCFFDTHTHENNGLNYATYAWLCMWYVAQLVFWRSSETVRATTVTVRSLITVVSACMTRFGTVFTVEGPQRTETIFCRVNGEQISIDVLYGGAANLDTKELFLKAVSPDY